MSDAPKAPTPPILEPLSEAEEQQVQAHGRIAAAAMFMDRMFRECGGQGGCLVIPCVSSVDKRPMVLVRFVGGPSFPGHYCEYVMRPDDVSVLDLLRSVDARGPSCEQMSMGRWLATEAVRNIRLRNIGHKVTRIVQENAV